MSELEKVLLTSFLTVFGGIVVYIAGQIVMKFLIEPIHSYKKLIGEIAYSLVFYASAVSDIPGPNDPKSTLRKQASELMSTTYAIPAYSFWAFCGLFPKQKNIIKASAYLIGLSNSLGSSDISSPVHNENPREIAKLLRIKIISERLGK